MVEEKLQDQCYDDRDDGTFVDQKWMNFIPAFFPDDVCISHNEGLNVAIWNLHERELVIEGGKYYVKVSEDRKMNYQFSTSLALTHSTIRLSIAVIPSSM